jgi:hypothetical protein
VGSLVPFSLHRRPQAHFRDSTRFRLRGSVQVGEGNNDSVDIIWCDRGCHASSTGQTVPSATRSEAATG